jgi:hypothetical protein
VPRLPLLMGDEGGWQRDPLSWVDECHWVGGQRIRLGMVPKVALGGGFGSGLDLIEPQVMQRLTRSVVGAGCTRDGVAVIKLSPNHRSRHQKQQARLGTGAL